MASPKKLLVLDLGMQSLRLAEFSVPPSGALKLLRGEQRSLELDPALEPSRPDQVKQALIEILKQWKAAKSDVVCVLPAHTVFTRVVPLDVPGGQIEAVVGFEAQQNIPFPLEEVVWDYVVMGETPTGAVNVAFVAVKTDVLESLCKAVTSAGLNIVSVTVAPLALYDCFRLSYPEDSESTTLLLDVGSRTSNMVIAAPNSFFSRSIPSGGLAVTTAIGKDIRSELGEAEMLKVQRGSVALGAGFEPPSDPVEANLARIARQTLLKTQADITRSMSYYRTTMGGADPTRIMITGGMASMPYLAEFFSEKLQKETGFFEPLRAVSVSENASQFVESNPNNLGELVGGALQATSPNRTEIHLLPPHLVNHKELAKRLPYLATAAVIFLISLSVWYGFAMNATAVTHSEAEKITSATTQEEGIDANIQKLKAEQAAIEKTQDDLLHVAQLREAYPQILAELNAKIPSRFLWITEIIPVGDPVQKGKPSSPDIKAVTVNGLYLDNPRQAAVIDDFVTSLQSSGIFLVEEKEKSKIITKRGSPNGEYWAYPFSLRIPLRNTLTPLP